MDNSNKSIRSAGPKGRTHIVKLIAAWMVGTLISFPSPGTNPPPEKFFISSYDTALDLLKNTQHLGKPLLESTYDSLHLYETCANTELSRAGKLKAARLLNEKLASPSFAKAYHRYKKSGKRLFTRQEAKRACASLAQYMPN